MVEEFCPKRTTFHVFGFEGLTTKKEPILEEQKRQNRRLTKRESKNHNTRMRERESTGRPHEKNKPRFCVQQR